VESGAALQVTAHMTGWRMVARCDFTVARGIAYARVQTIHFWQVRLARVDRVLQKTRSTASQRPPAPWRPNRFAIVVVQVKGLRTVTPVGS
jgi:hypothetical protein